ncbi:hypothetical protein BU26DRAFT_67263 [Trematosphaeria pertusa]|uniref:Uncharacterized protein n=1 Tax=Trematosphaeria pertusa TaxID=390896 RepID=A0A6A6I5M5_9PLEO|nr:uncharacterized protein BU26DRAFT_67263 [Trematosphaeria pertusa]KAF2245348.1 hypothetical protein BU26DRAFT_67263 [Trematosphaeria pertusa]
MFPSPSMATAFVTHGFSYAAPQPLATSTGSRSGDVACRLLCVFSSALHIATTTCPERPLYLLDGAHQACFLGSFRRAVSGARSSEKGTWSAGPFGWAMPSLRGGHGKVRDHRTVSVWVRDSCPDGFQPLLRGVHARPPAPRPSIYTI